MQEDRDQTDTERGAKARRTVRALGRAALATSMAENGAPYASLAMVATDHSGCPLMLLSDLAEHTRNIRANPAASLLFDATEGLDNPLTGTRVTQLGAVSKIDDGAERERLMARYLARHPDAAVYAGFADFNLYRLDVERVHVVAGFGVIFWLSGDAFLAGSERVAEVAAAESEIVAHVNQDHSDTVRLFAQVFAGGADGPWKITAADCDGVEIGLGNRRKRIPFDKSVFTATDARAALITLVEKARRRAENR